MTETKKFFPIIYSYADAIRLVNEFVGKKNHYSFNISNTKLVYFPFWVFNFSAFKEEKHLEEIATGAKAFNELENDFSDKLPSLERKTKLEETPIKPESNFNVEIDESEYSKKEAKEMITIKLAAFYKVPKQNVAISSLRSVYLPKWFVKVVLQDKKEYLFEVSLIKKEILNPEILGERIKKAGEQTRETLNELTNPSSWFSIPKELMQDFLGLIKKTPKTKPVQKIKQDTKLQYYIVIAILIILLAYFVLQILK